MSCMTILFSKLANHQIRHQATHKEGCKPAGDCTWSLQSSSGGYAGMYGLNSTLFLLAKSVIHFHGDYTPYMNTH